MARCGIESSGRLRRHRWVVERAVAVAEPLPAAEDTPREAGRRPPSVPRHRVRADLLALCPAFLLGILSEYADRIVSVDTESVGEWGPMSVPEPVLIPLPWRYVRVNHRGIRRHGLPTSRSCLAPLIVSLELAPTGE